MTEPLQSADMRLLVTGAAGFIGANFCHYWKQQYPRSTLVALDALMYAGNRSSLQSLEGLDGFLFVAGDINDQYLVEKLLREHRLNVIVHFAAESHVDRSIRDPDAFIQTNIVGTHSLLRVAKNFWLDGPQGRIPHRFHHVSTDEVYGTLGLQDPPFHEKTPYAPNSPYAASKAASDHLVRSYQHTYGLNTTVSNCSNNYGPYHFPEKLIPLIIINILHNQALPLYGDGRQIRDWLYVEDHCRGIAAILDQGREGESYNIGGNNEQANIDVVLLICRLLDQAFANDPELKQRFPQMPACYGRAAESLISYIEDRPGHDRRYAIDAKKISTELGYRPKYHFEEGMRKTIDWYLRSGDWWRPLLNEQYNAWLQKQYMC